jgi:hypothetical protein
LLITDGNIKDGGKFKWITWKQRARCLYNFFNNTNATVAAVQNVQNAAFIRFPAGLDFVEFAFLGAVRGIFAPFLIWQ